MPFPSTNPSLERALVERGYAEPTPVQAAVLQPDAAERDLLVSAQTGSGKTVAYGLALASTLLVGEERGNEFVRTEIARRRLAANESLDRLERETEDLEMRSAMPRTSARVLTEVS